MKDYLICLKYVCGMPANTQIYDVSEVLSSSTNALNEDIFFIVMLLSCNLNPIAFRSLLLDAKITGR